MDFHSREGGGFHGGAQDRVLCDLIQDQSAAAAVFWPNLTLLQPRSTDDAVMGTLPHAAGEEFCPMLQRPESFRTILCGTIFLSSVKVATGSRRDGHGDL